MYRNQSGRVRAQRTRQVSRAAIFALVVLAPASVLAASPSFGQVSMPGPDEYTSNRFDKTNELKITGEIVQVDKLDTGTIIWVHAASVVKHGFAARPGTEVPGKGQVWRVEGSGVAKIADVTKLTPGAQIVVTGVNSVDTTCTPTCRLRSEKVTLK